MSSDSHSDLKLVTAAMLVIGDEILSGRTQDKNVSFVATALGEIGIQLREVRIIPDVEQEIVDAINHFRKKYDYVFTSGGIGPTHDDITADSVAAAFGVGIDHHPEAMEILTRHYETSGIEFNDARKRMARIPDGADLIENPVSKAPGFRLENVFVMAGVPSILQAMMAGVLPLLSGGARMISRTIGVPLAEGKVAQDLGLLQDKYPEVSIGSYPYFRQGEVGTNLVLRSIHGDKLDAAFSDLRVILDGLGVTGTETT
ncbi:competence/damage-inducible protein A [Sneathiella chinensis]|uniref:Molybdenum cofactor biosynthesis protein n=1 Tax=Sneathiella chinensis TaxID=349750 RepID=A0ABQ5U546_9PROT|nr:molybdopterin-binding protein [Sneathiella chinensis]GLQ07290.1 molybdenum cofactor biosynthesis protein [Sneathiella chinensis]